MAISTGSLQMRRLHPRFGVEVAGVDLREFLHDGIWRRIRDNRCKLHTTVAGEGPTAEQAAG